MKTLSLLLAAFSLLVTAWLPGPAAQAQQKKFDFADDPVFKKLLGDWIGEGSLHGADGETFTIREEWTGKITEGGTLMMSGTRQWNDETQQFSWEFAYNAATDLVEVTYKASNAGDQPIRFESSISQADFSIQMKAPIGQQGELLITNRLIEENGEVTLVGDVTLKDDTQKETITGKVTHRKRKP